LIELNLQKLDRNTKILDIGVGTGIYFQNEECIKLIKEKNIKIHGIDIVEEDIEIAKKRIIKYNLQDNVSVEFNDLFKFNKFNSYDTIIFTESYPVIDQELMILMLKHIVNTKFNKNICFINNIEDNPGFIQKCKPYSKYFRLQNQFGRLVSSKDIEDTFAYVGITKDKISIDMLASATANKALFNDKIKLYGFDFIMKQYLISVDCS
jgi:23S rRNA G2445 N2-methylase RlmL